MSLHDKRWHHVRNENNEHQDLQKYLESVGNGPVDVTAPMHTDLVTSFEADTRTNYQYECLYGNQSSRNENNVPRQWRIRKFIRHFEHKIIIYANIYCHALAR